MPDRAFSSQSDTPSEHQFRTFGRAKGRTLTASQSALMDEHWPRISIDPHDALPSGPLWLEIGYGMGHHVLHLGRTHRDKTILGAEPFLNGTAKALRGVVEEGLDNVRLFRGDVREWIDQMPDSCLERVYILFPDPWPKSRHNKRRLIRTAFIRELYRILQPGGTLVFASDIPHYVDWALTRFRTHGGFDWAPTDAKVSPQGWPGTKYEAKARREGRTPYWFEFKVDKSA